MLVQKAFGNQAAMQNLLTQGNMAAGMPPAVPLDGGKRKRLKQAAIEEGISVHPMPDGSGFKCPACEKISTRKSDHIKHQRIHTKSKPYKCTMPNCDASFADPSTRSRHIRAHDPGARIKCVYPGCNKVYSRQSNMQRHLKTHEGSAGMTDVEQAGAMAQFNAQQRQAKNASMNAATLQGMAASVGMPLGGMGAMSAMMNLTGSTMPPHLNAMER